MQRNTEGNSRCGILERAKFSFSLEFCCGKCCKIEILLIDFTYLFIFYQVGEEEVLKDQVQMESLQIISLSFYIPLLLVADESFVY